MAQNDFGTINPATKTGSQLAVDLNEFRDAQNTNHSGTSRPSYVQAGMTWVNNTTNPWVVYMYDGTDDIAMGTVDTSTNKFIPGTNATTVFADIKQAATTSATGVVELATDAETQAGTPTGRSVTVGNLMSRTATTTRTGIAELATGVETLAITDPAKVVTPLALASLKATQGEVDTGTEAVKWVTPALLANYTPASEINYTAGIEYHIHTDGIALPPLGYDVNGNVTKSTWESFGPTGSGASNIFTSLDIIPTSAIAVKLRISATHSDTGSSGVYQVKIYGRKTGSGLSAAATTEIYRHYLYTPVGISEFGAGSSESYVVLDATNTFDIYWFSDSTNNDIRIRVLGWLD